MKNLQYGNCFHDLISKSLGEYRLIEMKTYYGQKCQTDGNYFERYVDGLMMLNVEMTC